jgi:hypothetical protein
MLYTKGYKYQLKENFDITIPIQPGQGKFTSGPFLRLYPTGLLKIKAGYAWDGCSGPTYDDDTNMTAGLVHDALYQLIRNDVLPIEPFRKMADDMLKELCIKNGMSSIRAWYYHLAVRKFGGSAVEKPKEVYDVK